METTTLTRPAGADLAEMGRAASRLAPTAALQNNVTKLARTYQTAKPFPHICIDGIWDGGVLNQILTEFPQTHGHDWVVWDTGNERKRTSRGIDGLSPFIQLFFLALCSNEFIGVLKTITGINDLWPDTTFFGAGLHETLTDGFLEVHGDYIKHPELPLARRLNLLVYLNHDWDPSWGGDLELWDSATTTCAAAFAPIFNRTILFNTTSNALHGSPAPLVCPRDRSRKMISVYYWSANPAAFEESRPIQWTPTRDEKISVKSFVPPIIGMAKRKVQRKLYRMTHPKI